MPRHCLYFEIMDCNNLNCGFNCSSFVMLQSGYLVSKKFSHISSQKKMSRLKIVHVFHHCQLWSKNSLLSINLY